MPRLHVPLPLSAGIDLPLPPGPARHVQVLRLQPGDALTLFDGQGGEWSAEVLRMGRSEVDVRVGTHVAVDRELPVKVTLALGMPANERMDTLVEKATELGVAVIQPLVCERSVLRLSGDRAARKVEHWRGVAVAAAEQSGRTAVPRIEPIQALGAWLRDRPAQGARGFVLSLRVGGGTTLAAGDAVFLSGPEGGLSGGEEDAAVAAGFEPLSLGPRTLRADTAPLAALMRLQSLG